MAKKTETKIIEMNNIAKLDTLTKLRMIVVSIFILSTLSIILLFITNFWISAVLILISYILVFALMVKLLTTKKL